MRLVAIDQVSRLFALPTGYHRITLSKRAGQAMGLNVFMLFTGFGLGSYLFGEALRMGFGSALAMFAVAQLLAAVVAVRLFRSETTEKQ